MPYNSLHNVEYIYTSSDVIVMIILGKYNDSLYYLQVAATFIVAFVGFESMSLPKVKV